MNRAFRFVTDRLLGKHLEFRVRLFNILASFGVLVSLASSVASFFLGDHPIEYVTYLLFALLSLALIVYGTKTGQYQRCYLITIVIIFMIGFPFFFFFGGVYYGALPYFFVFAILFTIFMLEGRSAVVVSGLELMLYISICVYARLFVSVKPEYLDEGSLFFESLFGFSVVSIALGICMFLHFRLYNEQQRELKSAREAAEIANEAKSLFLANMSHEIRTPIGIMLGMNEVILRETESEKIKVYARSAENAGQQLLTLINNILDMSSIEKGKLEITEESFATAELISELFTTGESLSRRRDLRFSVDADGSLPRALIGDMPRIRQIVSNLLSNAAKYTEQGSIILSFSVLPFQTAGEVVLRIAVADTGIGIKEDDVPRLFDVFTRGDTQGRTIEGSGLGLAIAKEYAKRMGGQVTIASKIGHGSVFAVEVVQKVSDAAPMGDWRQSGEVSNQHSVSGFTAPGCGVLIVDDNAENLQLIESLIAQTLMRTDTAASGAECLELVKKRPYDAILMDYMMPGMDGAETMRRLKEISGFDTPVIALTANVVSGICEKLLDVGFSRYLSKPVRLRDLEDALLDVLPSDRVTTGATALVERIAPETRGELARELLERGIVLEDGLRYVGGDIVQYGKSEVIFTESYFSAVGAVSDLARRSDWANLKFRVHSLKGNAKNLGANELSETAAKIERLCETGDGAYISAALPILYFEWDRAKNGLIALAEKLRKILPEQKSDTRIAPELGELCQMLQHNRYQDAMDALATLIAMAGDPERILKLREIRQKTDELSFREAERLLAALMESEAGGHGD